MRIPSYDARFGQRDPRFISRLLNCPPNEHSPKKTKPAVLRGISITPPSGAKNCPPITHFRLMSMSELGK
jgi:hypothetical protein